MAHVQHRLLFDSSRDQLVRFRSRFKGGEDWLDKLVGFLSQARLVLPENPGAPSKPVWAQPHALAQLRRRFPRYAGVYDDTQLERELGQFIGSGFLKETSPGPPARFQVTNPRPVWDQFTAIIEDRRDYLSVVTVIRSPLSPSNNQSKRIKTPRWESQDGSDSLVLMDVLRAGPKALKAHAGSLLRLEYPGNGIAYGYVYKTSTGRVLVSSLSNHDLVDYLVTWNTLENLEDHVLWLYDRVYGPIAGERIHRLEEVKEAVKILGIKVHPPSATALAIDLVDALLWRLGDKYS